MRLRNSFLFGLALSATACSVGDPPDLAIHNISVVDVESGAIAPNLSISVHDGDIVYVGPDADAAQRVVSGERLWAIPGLWDMHVHVSDPGFFPLFVMNGVVGVRDMGGGLEKASDGCGSIEINTLKSWRNAIRSGELVGPEIVLAGPVLSGTGAPASLRATIPEEARSAVATVAAAGSDFIKVYEDIPPAALSALAAAASEAELNFAGHVSEETLTILEALELGQRSVEHVRAHLLLCFAETQPELEQLYVSDDWNAQDRAWARRHRASCPEVWDAFRNRDAWLTPTLVVQEALEIGATADFVTDARRLSLPDAVLQSVEERGQVLAERTPEALREVQNWNGYIHRLVRRADQEGVRMLAGSDAACEGVIPGYGLHRELELLVQAGLSPLTALQAATLEPARYFQRHDQAGQLKSGFQADIVLLRRNPLEDISAVSDVYAVIIDGEIAFIAD